MRKLTDPRKVRQLTLLACLMYFASYITRINFGAIIVEFIAAENVAKPTASLITSVLFITYGAGQLVSGFLGDRVAPHLLIFVGLAAAAVANILLPLVSPCVPVMAVIWGINGIAQAFMWPPLVKILKSAFTDEEYRRNVPYISVSASAGTIAVYLIAPLMIRLQGWKAVFAVCAPVGLLTALLWLKGASVLLADVDIVTPSATITAHSDEKDPLWKVVPLVLITICIQGMLRDGISTWTPNLMSETFRLESAVSILMGVALPLFQIFVNMFVRTILGKMKNDVFACMVLFFAACTVLLAILKWFGLSSAACSLLLIGFVNGIVHGINMLQNSYVPALFHSSRNISFLAGLLNASTYVGSALATWLFAALSETYGWSTTALSWVILALAGTLIAVVCKQWHKRTA